VDFLTRWGITAGGYAAAAVFLWLFIGAKSDIKAEIERCNTEKLAAVAEAESALRDAQIASYEARLAELARMVADEAKAREIAQEAARLAESRPEKVRTVIREVASANACIDTAVPDAVLDSLRD
jgi:flagellar biosynthesis/type III secretory pathway M-ring protein FliF/YscJ